MRVKWFFATLLVFAVAPSPAQKPVAASANKQASAEQVPTIKLAFVEEKDTSQIGAAGFGPMGCTPDGAVFVDPWQPSAPETGVVSFAKAHDTYTVTTFAMNQISDVHDAHLRDAYPTESLLVMLLVNGTRDDAMSTSKRVVVVPSTGEQYEHDVKSGARNDYVATFDRQGNYKEAVELDLPFKPRRIAVFSSGLYLLIGSDTEHKPRFAFVNADGSLQRLLDTEKPMHGWEEMIDASGVSHGAPTDEFLARVPPQFGLSQIVSFHDKLLFVWPGLRWILEISPSGVLRRVPIHVPQGKVIDRFVPSDKMWYASFKESGEDYRTDQQTIVYEINPLDGMPIRRFDTAPEYVTGIICEHEGEFRAVGFHSAHLKLLKGTPHD
jgi:hypothetical protein